MAGQVLDAVYENGVFRVLDPAEVQLAEGQLVRIIRIEKLDDQKGDQVSTEVQEDESDNKNSTASASGD